MTKLETTDLHLWYGNFEALKGISMAIPEKEITARKGVCPTHSRFVGVAGKHGV